LIEPILDRTAILPLLERCQLPTADIETSKSSVFFGYYQDSILIAVVGLELYPPVGLLRSLAVAPEHRHRGIGRTLVGCGEDYGQSRNLQSLYLLTTTAAEFFTKLGYASVDRAKAPASIQATAQFSQLCPAASTLMCKQWVDQ
jgi:N-acetylglutamate synthase-like GNAT family acetyltransferase